MTYPIFVKILNENGISDTTLLEYEIAYDLYKKDIEGGDTTDCFCQWLSLYVSYEVMNGI